MSGSERACVLSASRRWREFVSDTCARKRSRRYLPTHIISSSPLQRSGLCSLTVSSVALRNRLGRDSSPRRGSLLRRLLHVRRGESAEGESADNGEQEVGIRERNFPEAAEGGGNSCGGAPTWPPLPDHAARPIARALAARGPFSLMAAGLPIARYTCAPRITPRCYFELVTV